MARLNAFPRNGQKQLVLSSYSRINLQLCPIIWIQALIVSAVRSTNLFESVFVRD